MGCPTSIPRPNTPQAPGCSLTFRPRRARGAATPPRATRTWANESLTEAPALLAEASTALPSHRILAPRPICRATRRCRLPGTSRVEPAGIEPATSCLQSRSVCPLVSHGVAQMPANAAFPLATGGHERTARDKLVPPWCPLGVRDLGQREEGGPRLPGCVSSRMRPRPRPLLRRRSPSARRAAACPRTRPSRARRC